MFEDLVVSKSLQRVQQAALFCEARHKVIANNIANINTPGFRARDLSVESFEKALARSEFKMSYEVIGSPDATTVRPNGNNVNIEAEMSKLSGNGMRYRVLLSLINHQMRLLEVALKGTL